MGTWENGVFDYDHLKRNYLPSYTRYWDEASQVPYLFNPSTSVWISYDDLQSISLKNDYIKRENLAGAMFWELSSDKNAELVGATFQALNNGQPPSPATNPPTAATVATTPSVIATTQNTPVTATNQATTQATTQQPSGSSSTWELNTSYRVGEQVTFEGRTYRCIQSHTSLPGWTPAAVPALWQLI